MQPISYANLVSTPALNALLGHNYARSVSPTTPSPTQTSRPSSVTPHVPPVPTSTQIKASACLARAPASPAAVLHLVSHAHAIWWQMSFSNSTRKTNSALKSAPLVLWLRLQINASTVSPHVQRAANRWISACLALRAIFCLTATYVWRNVHSPTSQI